MENEYYINLSRSMATGNVALTKYSHRSALYKFVNLILIARKYKETQRQKCVLVLSLSETEAKARKLNHMQRKRVLAAGYPNIYVLLYIRNHGNIIYDTREFENAI